MKAYLLDTHILLWWLSDDKRLTKKIRDVISQPNNYIFVSSVSIWEIMIKKALHKLLVTDNFREVLDASSFEFLPMTVEHAFYIEQLPFIHYDPFDRLLIAQCIVEDLIFVTIDTNIRKYNISYL